MAVVSECKTTVDAASSADTDLFAYLRKKDFARLDDACHTYLDYNGAALYPATLVTRHSEALQRSILGNPHSVNPASEKSASLLTAARRRLLDFLNADPEEYAVIFTANATAAIKLVAEGFPFERGSEFLLSTDNHNSVNGIREYARSNGAAIRYLPVDPDLALTRSIHDFRRRQTMSHSLFAYPAQSNFSGVQHSLDYVKAAQDAGYMVLLDAAAYVPSHSLDLSAIHADFVCVSFYKMFGYPTGIGALVARRRALSVIRRPWFSGGTVDYVSTQNPDIHQLVSHEHAFEDGSPNFTSLHGVIDGLDYLSDIGLSNIKRHTSELIELLVTSTNALKHSDGEPVVRWYGARGLTYGSVRAFNVVDKDGRVVPYEFIERLAGTKRISIRGGCFCNPGCAEAAFNFPSEQSLRCMKRLAEGRFSPARFADCLGTTEVGALRVSLGMANDEADIYRFVSFIGKFRNYRYANVKLEKPELPV